MSLNGSFLFKPPQRLLPLSLKLQLLIHAVTWASCFQFPPETPSPLHLPEDGDGKKYYFQVCSNVIYLGWRTSCHRARLSHLVNSSGLQVWWSSSLEQVSEAAYVSFRWLEKYPIHTMLSNVTKLLVFRGLCQHRGDHSPASRNTHGKWGHAV